MVVPNREIANTNIFSSSLAMSNPLEFNASPKDIQMNAFRGRSTVFNTNSSRESSILSKSSSIVYATHMEAQSGNLNWANQTKDELFNLSYQTPLGGGRVPNIRVENDGLRQF